MSRTAYFFDLDGTLIDSREGLFNSFRAGLAEIGVPHLGDAELQPFLGTPLPEMFRKLRADVTQAEIGIGMDAFRSFYGAVGIHQGQLYPDVQATLRLLRASGIPVWIVTSKPEPQARRVVSEFGLGPFVHGVVGAGLDETDTKTQLVARALTSANITDPGAARMVGDRFYDVVGAKENGVLPIGALWGYGTREELAAAGCADFASSLAEFQHRYVEQLISAVA